MSDNFQRGLTTGQQHESITIALNGTWGGRTKDGGSTSSYEKIGYHAGSIEFLSGVLASGCPVDVCVERKGKVERWTVDSKVTSTGEVLRAITGTEVLPDPIDYRVEAITSPSDPEDEDGLNYCYRVQVWQGDEFLYDSTVHAPNADTAASMVAAEEEGVTI